MVKRRTPALSVALMKRYVPAHIVATVARRISARAAALVAIFALLHAAVVASSPFLPFVDLPQHVAASRLLWNAGRPAVANLYEMNLVPQVNVLALFLGTPLHAALPEATAVRVLVVLGIGALAWSLLQISRRVGAPVWGAVAAMPLALHFSWMYGFLSFGLGIPILLLLLSRLAAPGNGGPPPRTVVADAVLWLLLALAHVLLMAFGICALGLRVSISEGPRRTQLVRGIAVIPAIFWTLAWWAGTRSTLARVDPGSLGGGIDAYWHGPVTKLLEVGRSLIVASTDGRLEWSLLIAVGITAIASLVNERRAGDGRREVRHDLRPGVRPDGRRWLRLVALVAVAAYALLPYSIYPRERVTLGLFVLYPRFLVLAPLIFLPTLAWPRGRVGATLAGIACAANVLLAWNQFELFQRAARDAVGLDAAIASIPPGRIVKSLIYTPHPTGLRYEGFLHVASYYQARRLGETDQSFALLPTNPVHYRDPRREHLSRQDEHLRPQEFDWQRARVYDFLLIYDRNGEWMRHYAGTKRPAVFAHNGWLVLGPS